MSMLRHRADKQTVAYIFVATTIPVTHWLQDEFNPWLLAAGLVMAFAISAMHHNHAHTSIWSSRTLNRYTDLWFTLFQGQPGFAFEPLHVENHHRHHNGPHDLTRTYLLHDNNNLPGLLLHPLTFASRAIPHIIKSAYQVYRMDQQRFFVIALHYLFLIAVDGALLWVNVDKTVYCILMPQIAALYFLLLSNYLQHAHADGESEFNHSRNFLGLINPLFFNVGYHTAHHYAPDLHWSELPATHGRIAQHVAPQLIESSFGGYCLRVFVLGIFFDHSRSRSMRHDANRRTN